MKITNMRVQCLSNPIGIQELNPVLSYTLKPEDLAKQVSHTGGVKKGASI